MSKPKRYIVTGGGTGGHVYPAIAIADAIRNDQPDCQILYVGTRGRAEEKIVPKRGYPLHFVHAVGMPSRPLSWAMLRFAFFLFWGISESMFILITKRPHAIIGTGGYVSAPVVFATVILRKLRLSKAVIAIHEQNIAAGRLNWQVARFADVVWVSFAGTEPVLANSIFVGYPVRKEIGATDRAEAKTKLGVPADASLVFAFGGSLGARTINRAVIDALPHLSKRDDLWVIHGMGTQQSDEYDSIADCQTRLASLGLGQELSNWYHPCDFVYDIEDVYAAADIVIGRAGAGTVTEVCSVGRASLLIPKANLPGDHQVLNAREMVRAGASEIIYEDVAISDEQTVEFVDGKALSKKIETMLSDRERLGAMERAAESLAAPHSLKAIVTSLEHLLADRRIDLAKLYRPEGTSIQDSYNDLAHTPTEALPSAVERLIAEIESGLELPEDNPGKRRELLSSALLMDDRTDYLKYRINSLLASSAWQIRNVGVKLAGLLMYTEKLPFLLEMFNDRRVAKWWLRALGGDFVQNGFIRRNSMLAITRIAVWSPQVKDALLLGLEDPYFEVRAWAAGAVGVLAWQVQSDPDMESSLLRATYDRYFEVCQSAVNALGAIGVSPLTETRIRDLWLDPNWKIREEAISAAASMVDRGVAVDTELFEKAMSELLVTSEGFAPLFQLKKSLNRFAHLLRNGSRLGNDGGADAVSLG